MSTEELKCCPFCGGKAAPQRFGNRDGGASYAVWCNSCHISTPWMHGDDGEQRAVATWTRRMPNSNSPEFDGIRSAAPAAGPEKDTARLNFMIAEECQIEHIDRIGDAPVYRVRWPWKQAQMRYWHVTAREAIDEAISAKEPPCSS